eukprot:Pgem_evm1s14952
MTEDLLAETNRRLNILHSIGFSNTPKSIPLATAREAIENGLFNSMDIVETLTGEDLDAIIRGVETKIKNLNLGEYAMFDVDRSLGRSEFLKMIVKLKTTDVNDLSKNLVRPALANKMLRLVERELKSAKINIRVTAKDLEEFVDAGLDKKAVLKATFENPKMIEYINGIREQVNAARTTTGQRLLTEQEVISHCQKGRCTKELIKQRESNVLRNIYKAIKKSLLGTAAGCVNRRRLAENACGVKYKNIELNVDEVDVIAKGGSPEIIFENPAQEKNFLDVVQREAATSVGEIDDFKGYFSRLETWWKTLDGGVVKFNPKLALEGDGYLLPKYRMTQECYDEFYDDFMKKNPDAKLKRLTPEISETFNAKLTKEEAKLMEFIAENSPEAKEAINAIADAGDGSLFILKEGKVGVQVAKTVAGGFVVGVGYVIQGYVAWEACKKKPEESDQKECAKALTELLFTTMADVGCLVTGPAYAACALVGNLVVHPFTEGLFRAGDRYGKALNAFAKGDYQEGLQQFDLVYPSFLSGVYKGLEDLPKGLVALVGIVYNAFEVTHTIGDFLCYSNTAALGLSLIMTVADNANVDPCAAIGRVVNFVGTIYNGIKHGISVTWDALKNAGDQAWKGIVSIQILGVDVGGAINATVTAVETAVGYVIGNVLLAGDEIAHAVGNWILNGLVKSLVGSRDDPKMAITGCNSEGFKIRTREGDDHSWIDLRGKDFKNNPNKVVQFTLNTNRDGYFTVRCYKDPRNFWKGTAFDKRENFPRFEYYYAKLVWYLKQTKRDKTLVAAYWKNGKVVLQALYGFESHSVNHISSIPMTGRRRALN